SGGHAVLRGAGACAVLKYCAPLIHDASIIDGARLRRGFSARRPIEEISRSRVLEYRAHCRQTVRAPLRPLAPLRVLGVEKTAPMPAPHSHRCPDGTGIGTPAGTGSPKSGEPS